MGTDSLGGAMEADMSTYCVAQLHGDPYGGRCGGEEMALPIAVCPSHFPSLSPGRIWWTWIWGWEGQGLP
jgi:hypothetical protein